MLGGGQLGRMVLREAQDLDVHISILDPSADCPASSYANEFVLGDFRDYHTVLAFGDDKDLLTIEIEDVNTQALFELEEKGKKVFPQPAIIELIKDKGIQKEFYRDHGIPTSSFWLGDGKEDLKDRWPCVQKLRVGGYDGKGVKVIQSAEDAQNAFDAPCVIEALVDIDKEISVIGCRNEFGEMDVYPAVEMVFDPQANLVDYLISPANIRLEIEQQASDIVKNIMQQLNFVGVLAVELFLDANGALLVNEMAPRTHNSGHQTIEGSYTSQFAQHLRMLCGLKPGNTGLRSHSAMVNVLGAEGFIGPAVYEGIEEAIALGNVYPHLYGKATTKPFRKMGHITILGDTAQEVMEKAKKVRNLITVKTD